MANDLKKTATAMREFALGLPGAHEDMPWGERVAKVNKKVFVFLGKPDPDAGQLRFSVKLPQSSGWALSMPFTEPTGYGLGKSGWVTSKFQVNDAIPIDMLLEWVDESFRAIAPKHVLAQLEQPETPPKPKRSKKKKEPRTK